MSSKESCTVKAVGIKPRYEVADIFHRYGEQYRQNHALSNEQHFVMRQITRCRTAAVGGHMEQCGACGFEKNAYNSCRNRHCPKCQNLTKERWLDDRRAELLPTGYFHLVFTLPHEINPLILCNKKTAFHLLFHAVNDTLQSFAQNRDWRLNGELGIIAVLHTWSQTLVDHFHLHCLIPAGALSLDGKSWHPSRQKFLFRATSLGKAFKRRYLDKLDKAYKQGDLIFPGKIAPMGTVSGFAQLMSRLEDKRWIVYAKRPFAGPEQVLGYLGRYTHRVAISNERISSIEDGKVSFAYKDRSDGNKRKSMTLDAGEFIRRFLLHVLPHGFMKIRHFGFLANKKKQASISRIRSLVDLKIKIPEKGKETAREIMLRLTGKDIALCPKCKKGLLVTVGQLERTRGERDFMANVILDSS